MEPTTPEPLAFLPLHPLEFRILMILLEEPSHGYAIVQEIEAQETRLPSIYPGNLYRRIRDLRAKGLLADTPPPNGEDADPRRKYFRLTHLGRAVGKAEAERLRNLLADARGHGLVPEV
jgi:DNA-binding PadR family transcriptional regulator